MSIAVFVAHKVITLGIFGSIITASGFQEYLKFSACLRRFKLCFAVVGVFDDSDSALDDLLGHIACRGVIFHGVVLRRCADRINGVVQQVALGGRDLTNGPVVAADIVFRGELSVCVCGVTVDQLLALVNAVSGSGKRSVALCCACFFIALGDGDIPLFQNVGKALLFVTLFHSTAAV